MTTMTKADFQKAAARFAEQRSLILKDIEQMIERDRRLNSFAHLAHNLASRVTELAAVQARFDTMEQMASFTEE
jgi:hypothetical protein